MRRVLVVILAGLSAGAPAAAAAAEEDRPPNIVVITTDDQPVSTWREQYMPRTFRRIVERGTEFTDGIVVVPLCCPSRATLVTGQYPHNHGVLANDPGYPELLEKGNVLPAWLQRAGYVTGHVGKWMHGYTAFGGPVAPPGWDRWFTLLAPRQYHDYRIGVDGEILHFGNDPRENVTRVLNREARRFVAEHAGGERPLYLQLDHYAPHPGKGIPDQPRCEKAPEPPPGDRGAHGPIEAPRPPSFNESDVADKPPWVRVPPLDERGTRALDRRYRCTVESLLAVDRGIEQIFRELRRAGELRNTAFVFLSDNGFFFGEHRFERGKSPVYEPSIRVPIAIRLPGSMDLDQQPSIDATVGSHDIVPTVLELAGVAPCVAPDRCRVIDGRSLIGLLGGEREGFEDRALLIELDEGEHDDLRLWSCAYQAVRTADDLYVEHTRIPGIGTGICEEGLAAERYDLATDRDQLHNLAPATSFEDAVEQLKLRERLNRLRECAGIEGRDPRSAGGFCE